MLELEGVRILLVEDDDDSREMTRMALEARGAILACAADARAARDAIEHDPPDVLLSDIHMPGEDGHSLMRHLKPVLRKRGLRIPAVALTGLDSREARLRSRDAGYHYHLTKPVDPERLVEILAGLARLTGR